MEKIVEEIDLVRKLASLQVDPNEKRESAAIFQEIDILNLEQSTTTTPNFVISTIAYVPSSYDQEYSSDEEEDGTFSDNQFNFDPKKENTHPFKTKNTKKDLAKFDNQDGEQEGCSKSKIVEPFLKKLSEGGFEKSDPAKKDCLVSASIALNRMKSLSSRKNKSLIAELKSKIESDIRYEIFAFFWQYQWYDQNGKKVDFFFPRKFYKQLKYRNPEKAKMFLDLSEKVLIPYQNLREYAKNHDKTKNLIEESRTSRDPKPNIYLSFIDIDTVNFNGIYSAYLRIVHKNSTRVPTVMSTGYEFPENDVDGTVFQMASELDRNIRAITALEIPLGVYYPEPNTCVLIPIDQKKLPESFIDEKNQGFQMESARIIAKIVRNRKDPIFVFSDDSPLITTIPDRAKSYKSKKTQINFCPRTKQGASLTEEDFRNLKHVAQSHLHNKVYIDSLFNYGAIKLKTLEDFVLNPADLPKCKLLLREARNFNEDAAESRKMAIEQLKKFVDEDIVERMVQKHESLMSSLRKKCKSLVSDLRNTQEPAKIKEILDQLGKYIPPTMCSSIAKVTSSIGEYVIEFKKNLRSEEETKFFNVLNENSIQAKFLNREMISMLAENNMLKGVEREDFISSFKDIDEDIDEYDFSILLELLTDEKEFVDDYLAIRATGKYTISYILKKYQEDETHLIFMANDPTEVIFDNRHDKHIVSFGVENYENDIDSDTLKEKIDSSPEFKVSAEIYELLFDDVDYTLSHNQESFLKNHGNIDDDDEMSDNNIEDEEEEEESDSVHYEYEMC